EGGDVFDAGGDEALRGIVPEPTVLLLMSAALPLVFFKRLRRVFSS
ncbi:MAG: PEP-CTERM sorting domain-containing protein, partial [Planctomycetes bacterium]|nr:PEP-CTERM sorting domain-containing protein [Planctomycetota bacterium]